MYKTIYSVLALAVLTSCSSTKTTTGAAGNTTESGGTTMTNTSGTALSKVDADAGFVSIFDGKTLAGWHSYGKSAPGQAWKVDNGAIHLDAASKQSYQTNGGGDLITDAEYENYDLRLDWKISPNGNSGIIINTKEDTTKYSESWYTGMEMQVLDNDGHSDGKIPKHRAGNLYDLIAVSKETVKPVGEWNAVQIVNNRGKLDLYLNGEHVVETRMDDDAWRALIAGSKFKDMPDFAKFSKGRIGLQDHGNDVWYRNIRIKQL
ncbi:MAG TPA: DUF1080 domain-containing protein, partial [Chitinophagaceae bacterium]|nr:DUF1080 domain-containing protein [Chitinophagaceae bacterium]